MQKDLISVIVPVYNVENYIRRSIDSILLQTYRNLEIILIDDGSTDLSGAICDEYALKDNRVVVFHKNNGGQAMARNMGIDNCHGRYVYFLDSDDWVETDILEYLYTISVQYDTDISLCASRRVKSQDCSCGESKLKEEIKVMSMEDVSKDLYLHNNVRFELWNKLWRYSLIEQVRFKDGQICEEVYFDRMTFGRANKMVYSNQIKHNYLDDRPGNTNSSFKTAKLVMFEEFKNWIKDLIANGEEVSAKYLSCIAAEYACDLYFIANNSKQSPEILDKIRKHFIYFYKLFKNNNLRTRHGKQICSVFYRFPRLYCFIKKVRAEKRLDKLKLN